jgi:DNA primase
MARSLKDIVKSDYGLGSFPFVDVEEFIESQGIEFTKSGDWLKMRCILPFGHKDHSPSMFIHSKHGAYNCFVCGTGNWNQLCEHMEWNVEIESITIDGVPDVVWKDTQEKIKNIDKNKTKEHSKSIPKGFKKITITDKHCIKHHKYMVDRNIENLIDMFNVGYVPKGDSKYGMNFVNRIIIPCHDNSGNYMWCEGRAIVHTKVDRKYYRPFGINKTKYLFNYHRVIRANYDWVIVVEGIIDAMILWSWRLPGVCCFGASISDEQISLLSKFNKVFVCLDNDPAGIKGWIGDREKNKNGVKQKLIGIGISVNRIMMPKGKDVNNLTEIHFKKLLKKSKKIV